MKLYNIIEASNYLDISRHTLRYYDKIGLLSPKRGENNYRYYTSEDILALKYTTTMKFCGFPLKQIADIINNRRNPDPQGACIESTVDILESEQQDIVDKIIILKQSLLLIQDSITMLQQNNLDSARKNRLNKNIEDIYAKIRGEKFDVKVNSKNKC